MVSRILSSHFQRLTTPLTVRVGSYRMVRGFTRRTWRRLSTRIGTRGLRVRSLVVLLVIVVGSLFLFLSEPRWNLIAVRVLELVSTSSIYRRQSVAITVVRLSFRLPVSIIVVQILVSTAVVVVLLLLLLISVVGSASVSVVQIISTSSCALATPVLVLSRRPPTTITFRVRESPTPSSPVLICR
uniref:Uncharacterized protein n=1 Tax=Cacopsylla melanoneura TaxID=428564 RepID=A0A8D8RAK6_9HEMI